MEQTIAIKVRNASAALHVADALKEKVAWLRYIAGETDTTLSRLFPGRIGEPQAGGRLSALDPLTVREIRWMADDLQGGEDEARAVATTFPSQRG